MLENAPASPEAALQLERERLRSVLQLLPVGVFLADAQGRILETSPAVDAIWGRSRPPVGGPHEYALFEAYWPAEGRRVEAHEWGLACALRGEVCADQELDIVGFDGVARTILASAQPIRDASGAIAGAVMLHTDVTAQRRAAREHDKALALLDTFLASSPVGLAFLDRSLRYMRINPALAALNGRPPHEHIGRSVREVLGDLADQFEPPLRAVLETGAPFVEPSFSPPPGAGPARRFMLAYYPVEAGGERLGVGVVVVDVTDRVRSEESLRFLVDATTVLSASLDLDTTLTSVARLGVERLGDFCLLDVLSEDGQTLVRREALARRPEVEARLRETLSHPPPPHAPNPIHAVMRTGEPVLVTEVTEAWLDAVAVDPAHRAVLGALRPSSVMSAPLRARERTLGVLTVGSQSPTLRFSPHDLALLFDLAQRAALALDNARLFQQASRAVAARDEFVAIASHELRTPLGALGLQLHVLSRLLTRPELDTARLASGVAGAQRHVERLETLLGHLLDVSHLSTGRLTLQREEVDLCALAHEVVGRLGERLAEAGCTLQLRVGPPVVGRWDRLRLEQVVNNLLSNAAKYAPGAPVEVSVEREGSAALLTVRDHGPGIAPGQHERIFERFQRASGQHQRTSLGLGLYIARHIARAHGGDLAVRDALPQGACFTLRLPLE